MPAGAAAAAAAAAAAGCLGRFPPPATAVLLLLLLPPAFPAATGCGFSGSWICTARQKSHVNVLVFVPFKMVPADHHHTLCAHNQFHSMNKHTADVFGLGNTF
jgi:hypothetical protein